MTMKTRFLSLIVFFLLLAPFSSLNANFVFPVGGSVDFKTVLDKGAFVLKKGMTGALVGTVVSTAVLCALDLFFATLAGDPTLIKKMFIFYVLKPGPEDLEYYALIWKKPPGFLVKEVNRIRALGCKAQQRARLLAKQKMEAEKRKAEKRKAAISKIQLSGDNSFEAKEKFFEDQESLREIIKKSDIISFAAKFKAVTKELAPEDFYFFYYPEV